MIPETPEDQPTEQTMLEKMARAFCYSIYADPDSIQNGEKAWEFIVPQIRAVLKVLENPDERMISAGIAERHETATPQAWNLATANIFTAMIKAIGE